MKPPKILYFSDIHLDAKTDGNLRLSELEEVLDFCIGLVKTEKVEIVVFGGDACDPDGPYVVKCIATMADFARGVSMCNGGNTSSYWLAGNHDICEDGFGSTVLDPLRALPGSLVVAVPGVHSYDKEHNIGFLPYPSRLTSYNPVKEIEMWSRNNQIPDIIFGHLSIPGITPGSESQEMARGREHCWPAKKIRMLFPDTICFGGHYHKGDTYWLDGLAIQVVGAPARFTHGEEENKPRVAIIEGKTCRYVAIPNARCLQTISIAHVLGETTPETPRLLGTNTIVRLRHGPGATAVEIEAAVRRLVGIGAGSVRPELAEHEAAAPAVQVTAEDGFAIAEQLARDIRTGEAALDQAIVELTKAVAGDAQ